MAFFERMRDVVSGPLVEELVRRRSAAGWQLVSLEWRRELPDDSPSDAAIPENIPYGLRISEDCLRLAVNSGEHQVMLRMMEMLVQDFPFSSVASDLNEKGFRMRDGRRWNPATVFEMIPRLIEVGPQLFATEDWESRRQKFARMV